MLVKGQVAFGEEEMTDVVCQAGIRPVEVPGLSRSISPMQDLRAFLILYRLLRRIRPHIVHTHKSKAGVLGRLAAWMAGVPVTVHTFHGLAFKGYFSWWKTALVVWAERLFARHTDVLIAVTHRQKGELLEDRIAPSSRIFPVPLGLDLEPFLTCNRADDAFRRELGVASSVPLVGIVARLVPIKDIETFLLAAKQVVQQMPEARFAVVGDGELREELEAFARQQGIADVVHFAGFRRDMVRIYGALDLVALSSIHEGLPVSLIEAIAAGCYVVASRVGGVADLVRNEQIGLMVSPGNNRALAAAIVRALTECRRVPEEERRQVGIRYGINRLTEDLDHLYRTLLDHKQSRQAGGAVPGVCGEGMSV